MDKRLTNSWCTGKDSNLRTSLGGTDLQSVGFNHSPTCAKTFGRCGLRSNQQTPYARAARKHSGQTRGPQQHKAKLHDSRRLYSQDVTRETLFATQGNQGFAHKTPRRSLHAGKMRMECVGKTCCAATKSAATGRKTRRLSNSLPGAGEGIRTPDPLITNQMLYRLSYACNSGERRAFA